MYKAHIIIIDSAYAAYVYTDWLAKNIITEYEFRVRYYKYSFRSIHIFWFVNLEDAMAFKLRWL